MRFLSPWWLLALIPALPVVVTVARFGRRTVPARQHKAAVTMRATGVVLLVLALAQPLLVRSSPQRSVLFLLDRSSSVTTQARQAQETFVRDAIDHASATDLTAVAVFGRELRLDEALSATAAFDGVETVVDPTATDLASALRSAAAVLPTEGSRRIVVLTDAVETVGSARSAAQELADSGIAVDVITLATGRASDALVQRVDAPVTAREGDRVPVTIDVQSTAGGPAELVVTVGDEEIVVPVVLEVGLNRIEVDVPATETGVLRVDARVEAGFDAIEENNEGQALVRVLGPPQIAVVEGRVGEGEDLVRALTAAGLEAETLTAIPDAEGLLDFDGVVLVNVHAPSEAVTADLASFVEDLGRGLVVIGGDQAYGLGNYQDSALEDLLPVTSDPDDLIRRQPVAQVLAIDTSGSMADCHCDGVSDHDPNMQGGINKTDISRAGAALAIGALQPTDRVGVLAFTTGSRWALELDNVPDATTVAEALATLTPQGDTEIAPALRQAMESLLGAPEEIRHIILFTDGWTEDPELLEIAQEIAANGITLSVLGTGEGTGETLRRLAALGGGQFYAGTDLAAVPEIFVEETLRVARPLIAEGAFLPALGAASQVTAGLTSAPPLRGYVLVRAKDTAQIPLEIGPGDPLLATWQRGLGRATTWASDATARWSADWITWDGYVDFWGRVVRDVLPPSLDTPPEVRFDGGAIEIGFDADVPLDAVAIATVRDAAGNVTAVPLQRTGESTFRARVPVTNDGAYWVAVTVENADGVVASGSGGVVAGYDEEFAFRQPDVNLGADLAAATGGRVEPVAAEVYDPAPARGAAETPLWPLLVAVALALFLLDVATRRLVVAKGDLEAWRETLTRRRRPVEALATPPARAPAPAPGQPLPDEPPPREVHPEEETFGELLKRKRRR
jgi:Mg-chelatase subunit ChlD